MIFWFCSNTLTQYQFKRRGLVLYSSLKAASCPKSAEQSTLWFPSNRTNPTQGSARLKSARRAARTLQARTEVFLLLLGPAGRFLSDVSFGDEFGSKHHHHSGIRGREYDFGKMILIFPSPRIQLWPVCTASGKQFLTTTRSCNTNAKGFQKSRRLQTRTSLLLVGYTFVINCLLAPKLDARSKQHGNVEKQRSLPVWRSKSKDSPRKQFNLAIGEGHNSVEALAWSRPSKAVGCFCSVSSNKGDLTRRTDQAFLHNAGSCHRNAPAQTGSREKSLLDDVLQSMPSFEAYPFPDVSPKDNSDSMGCASLGVAPKSVRSKFCRWPQDASLLLVTFSIPVLRSLSLNVSEMEGGHLPTMALEASSHESAGGVCVEGGTLTLISVSMQSVPIGALPSCVSGPLVASSPPDLCEDFALETFTLMSIRCLSSSRLFLLIIPSKSKKITA
ncbi:hypothetical protein Anapl_05873 [Anas platyrhynchos]|uniref:Uncharacterized protein n=1 Tax=Anas platyrhynchos TaxID=8839 RepID=R0KDX4_ANAPL|nr:hypothetical protein Anapl_05873 [Anas platyrhynchos]